MATTVTLERGKPEQKAALEHLIQLYVHDFSDFLTPERRAHLCEDGRFPDFPGLESYWTQSDSAVWFIRVEGRLAGFALINRHSHSRRALDFNVGEFFVARPYRRDSVGARAVVDLANRHPGWWETAVARRNIPAQRFWPRAIAKANVADVETLEGDGVEWTGPIFRFRILPG